jgi:cell division protein FtsI/penicillin-binding protein 2
VPPINRRIGLLFAFFLLLLSAAGARAAYLGSVRAPALQRAAATQQASEVEVPALRGTIRDRRGIELAVSEAAADVSANPRLITDPLAVARRIAPLLGQPQAKVLERLTKRDTGFVYLTRQLPAAAAQRISRLRIEGIDTQPTARRVYPRGWLASQVLGLVGIDQGGLAGLEQGADRWLHGRPGLRRIVRDALGQPIEIRDMRHARPGRDVELTLDAAIQDRVEQVLQELGETYRPKGATAIVMDPRTSAVLALANWPRVDANDVGGAPEYARQNRAVGYTYEPGSTFKAFTVAGALEDGRVTPTTSFNLAPQIQVADRTIHDAEPRGWVTLTTAQILAQSSNVGAITIGQRLGARRFDQWVRRFGFGQRTGIELPGEERGLILPVEKYSGSSMGNLPIGQGELVTPMQIATAYAAIANGGILRRPQLIARVGGRRVAAPRGRRVISARVSAELREMLEGVLATGGTASEVKVPGYQLAGKTGTANKVDADTGQYSNTRYIASFVGFAPALRPEVLVAVMVDEPQGSIYGGQVAAPAFGKILEFALPYLGIPPG